MSDDKTSSNVDMTRAIELLGEATAIAEQLDGIAKDEQTPNNKERMNSNAQRSRLLMYGAHVADLARAEILNQFYVFRGEDPPKITL